MRDSGYDKLSIIEIEQTLERAMWKFLVQKKKKKKTEMNEGGGSE